MRATICTRPRAASSSNHFLAKNCYTILLLHPIPTFPMFSFQKRTIVVRIRSIDRLSNRAIANIESSSHFDRHGGRVQFLLHEFERNLIYIPTDRKKGRMKKKLARILHETKEEQSKKNGETRAALLARRNISSITLFPSIHPLYLI